MGLRLALVIALGGAALIPADLRAQAVGVGVDGVRDDIPATHVRWTLEGTAQPLSSLFLTLRGRSLRVDQEPFQGLPGFEESLQTGYGEAAALLGNAALIVGAGVNRTQEGETDTEYLVRGQYALLFGSGSQAVTTTFTVEAARTRDVSVATAIAEGITYDRVGGGLDLRLGQGLSATARLHHDRYSDENVKTEGYAYGLLRIAPLLSIGYAYAFADTELDNWRFTGSTRQAGAGPYEYHYFYYPYFTPQQEWGHSGLAVFQWSSEGGSSLAASATVPVYSRGQIQDTPQSGTTPAPPPTSGYKMATDILPLQARASASLRLLPGVFGMARYEYFRKPYYSYQSGGVGLQLTF